VIAADWRSGGGIVRLLIVSVVVLALATISAKFLATALLPLYRSVFEWIGGDYRVLFFGLASQGADQVIRVDVTLAHAVVVGTQFVMPDPRGAANATTLIGNTIQPLAVGLIAAMAWPSARIRVLGLRLLILLPLLLIVTLFDIPFLLAGQLWGIFFDRLSPGSWSPLLAWNDFLQGGGRFALGLAAAVCSVALSNRALASRNISAVTNVL
jgi:hypothetical protein